MDPNLTTTMLDAAPVQFAIWLSCLLVGLKIYNEARRALGKDKTHLPQPMVTRREKEYALHEDLLKVDARVTDLQREMRADIGRLNDAMTANYNKLMESSADGRRRIFASINDLAKVISDLGGKISVIMQDRQKP